MEVFFMSKKRNKAMCHATKQRLIEEYGYYCFICGRYDKNVQHHHILWHSLGGSDNYENGSLLCDFCHVCLHGYEYTSKEVQQFNNLITKYKQLKTGK